MSTLFSKKIEKNRQKGEKERKEREKLLLYVEKITGLVKRLTLERVPACYKPS